MNNKAPRTKKPNPNLKIIQWNARSLYPKITEFKNLIMKEEPDIVTINESWLNPTKKFQFKGYKVFRNDRDTKGGGVLIMTKEKYQVTEQKIKPFQGGVTEVISVKLKTQNGWSSIMTMYNPCKTVTTAEFEYYFSQLTDPALLTGDLNAKHPTWDKDVDRTGNNLIDALYTSDLQLLTPPGLGTYVSPATAKTSCLDLILGSTKYVNMQHRLGPYLGSDHIPVISTTLDASLFLVESTFPKWIIKGKTKEFTEASNLINASGQVEDSIESNVQRFIEELEETANKFFKKTTGGSEKSPSNPWWNQECEDATKERNKAWNTWCKKPTTSNKIEFKRKEAAAKRITLRSKREAWDRFCANLDFKTSSSVVWGYIRALSGRTSKFTYPIQGPNMTTIDTNDKVHIFAQKFYTSPPKSLNLRHFIEKAKGEPSSSGIERPFSKHELDKTIQTLKKRKSPGPDGIPNEMIQLMGENPRYRMLEIVNRIWQEGYHPKQWKDGHVIPIPKPGKDNTDADSYRQITLLSALGKTDECMVKNRLEYFCESNNVFSKTQCGFRPHKSTRDILLYINNEVRDAISSKETVCIAMIDLKGAFDKALHEAILYQCTLIGIKGTPLKWIESFLKNRTSAVRIGGIKSNQYFTETGIPQGSTLSPILFNILLHNLPFTPGCTILSYADDITVVSRGRCPEDVINTLQAGVTNLEGFIKEIGQEVNAQKSVGMIFTNKRKYLAPKLKINNTEIEYKKEHMLLGVMLDAPRLTYSKHINYLKTDCLKRINIMRKIAGTRWGCDRIALKSLYLAYIRPKIEHSCEVMINANKTNMQQLEVIQNSAIRVILGALKSSPIHAMQVEIGLPPITDHITLKAILLYKRNTLTERNSLNEITCQGKKYRQEMEQLLDTFGIPRQEELHTKREFSPPWVDKREYMKPELQENTTKQQIGKTAKEIFEGLIQTRYKNQVHIYTDASKVTEPNSTACAVYREQERKLTTWKLPTEFSVYSGELLAIYKAIEMVHNEPKNSKAVIFSDSKSAIEAIIADKAKGHYLTNMVNAKINSARINKNLTITIQWVPGHSDITGNEIADAGANHGHTSKTIEKTQISYREFKELAALKWVKNLNHKISQKLSNTTFANITESPEIETGVRSKIRTIDVAYTRLRLGHTKLAAELYKKGLNLDPNCTFCRIPQIIDHFLLECVKYTAPRVRLRRNLYELGITSFTRQTLLHEDRNDPKNVKRRELVMQFLVETKEASHI